MWLFEAERRSLKRIDGDSSIRWLTGGMLWSQRLRGFPERQGQLSDFEVQNIAEPPLKQQFGKQGIKLIQIGVQNIFIHHPKK